MDREGLSGSGWAVQQDSFFCGLPELRQLGSLADKLNHVPVQQIKRLSGKDHLISLDSAELVDLDPRRFAGVRMLRLLQRQDFTPVRLGPADRLFQVAEELLRDARPFGVIDGTNLK